MRGDEQHMPREKSISVQRPVDERLIQHREPAREVDTVMVQAVAEHLLGEDHGLSEEEVMRCAFVYARGYKEGVEAMK